ncbi:hypothetical protein [Rickettsia endosymbiont of Pantilius tunicatus]|uniref:hypothetical protein n=1 Tax=Rickettsia endosymbiont of Pantilius tunicatus TaxID=3066267 RepID=UPI0030E2777C
MTPLIRAVLANLPKSTNFIVELLEDNNLLKEQIIHKDAVGRDILDQLLYTKIYLYKPYKENFIEKKLISVVPEKIINFLTENSDDPYKFVQLFCGSGELVYAATGINFKEY